MATISTLNLASATVQSAKPRKILNILTQSSSKITLFSHKSSIQSLSLLQSHLRIFPFTFFATAFSESQKEEEEEKEFFDESATEQKQDSVESRRIYVGNLSFSITSSEISEIFSQAGKIEQVEIIYGRTTQRSRGFGFVTMSTSEEANEAIRMFDGAQFGGRTMKVNFPEVPKGGEREVMGPKLRTNSGGYVNSPHKIYVGNLEWKITSEALRDAFSDNSGLIGARVIYERDSGRSRGFGFVTFVSEAECQAALEAMNGKMVAGRPLRLSLASEKPSSKSPFLAPISAASEIHGEEISEDQESSLESTLV